MRMFEWVWNQGRVLPVLAGTFPAVAGRRSVAYGHETGRESSMSPAFPGLPGGGGTKLSPASPRTSPASCRAVLGGRRSVRSLTACRSG